MRIIHNKGTRAHPWWLLLEKNATRKAFPVPNPSRNSRAGSICLLGMPNSFNFIHGISAHYLCSLLSVALRAVLRASPHIYLRIDGQTRSQTERQTDRQTGKRLFVSGHFHNAAIMRVINLGTGCSRFHWPVISVDQHSINILISCLYAVCQADNAIWL